jgi:hypothetical protein
MRVPIPSNTALRPIHPTASEVLFPLQVIVPRENRLLLVVPEHFNGTADASTTKFPTKLAWFFFPNASRFQL